MKKIILALAGLIITISSIAQVDESKIGGWYGYLWNTKFSNSNFGLQGDIQYRNWNVAGDLSQLLIRAGVNYTPNNTNLRFTLGYASNFTSGMDETETELEHRIYQELIMPQKVGNRIYLRHRYRYEQRFIEGDDFRTRLRYALFMSIPFNKTEIKKDAIYMAFYNELFINGQRDVGNGREVPWFNQHRISLGLGYAITDNFRIQGGMMMQTTNSFQKGAIKVTFHHRLGDL